MKKIVMISGLVLTSIILSSCIWPKEVDVITNEAPQNDAIVTNKAKEQDPVEQEVIESESVEKNDMDWSTAESEMMKEGEESEMSDNSNEEWTEEELAEMKMMSDDHAIPMKKAWVYANYDSSLLGVTDNTVIFFHAAWCPSCVAADSAITAWALPAGLTVLKADFDTELEMRKKYGVTGQHTFVQVDASGEMITKWSGGNSIDSIVSKLK